MTVQRIKELHDRRPFEPFTIHMADGDAVAVKSPEFLWVVPPGRTIHVAVGEDEVRYIDLLLVTQLTTGRRNGKHRKAG